jgi:hypothetical protein
MKACGYAAPAVGAGVSRPAEGGTLLYTRTFVLQDAESAIGTESPASVGEGPHLSVARGVGCVLL